MRNSNILKKLGKYRHHLNRKLVKIVRNWLKTCHKENHYIQNLIVQHRVNVSRKQQLQQKLTKIINHK